MVLEVVICLHIMTVPIVDQDVGLIFNNSSLEGVNVSPPDTNSLAAAYETCRTQVSILGVFLVQLTARRMRSGFNHNQLERDFAQAKFQSAE